MAIFRQSTDIIPWDTLGRSATPNILHTLAEAVSQLAEADDRVASCEVKVALDNAGIPSLLWVCLTASVNAIVITEQAILTLNLEN